MFRRERLLDIYHAVESLCFYTAKEIAAQMQVVDGALTLRVPHGPTCMRVVIADLLRVLPAHILATRATTEENARAWFPQPDTHWGLESAAQLPEYRRARWACSRRCAKSPPRGNTGVCTRRSTPTR